MDRRMDVDRLEEELKILQQEMLAFMKFYKDKMLPSLQMQRTNLLNIAKGMREKRVCSQWCPNDLNGSSSCIKLRFGIVYSSGLCSSVVL